MEIKHYDQIGFITIAQGWFQIFKLMNVILHINRHKEKSYDHMVRKQV